MDTFVPAGDDITLTLTALGSADDAPDDRIVLRCRIIGGSKRIAGAQLRFVLPPEIIVAADEPAATVIPPLEPCAESFFTCSVSVHPSIDDDIGLRFEAVLLHPQTGLSRSNVVLRRIRRRAYLHGPQTKVTLCRTEVPDEVLVEAIVVNTGRGLARNVMLDLPAPLGTCPAEPSTATLVTLGRIPAGASRAFAYRAKIIARSLRSIRVTDARLHIEPGFCVALAPSPALPLLPAFTAPSVSIERAGRQLGVRIRGLNAGLGAASDVEFMLQWPPGFTLHVASLHWNAARIGASDDGRAYARAEIRPDGARLTITSIDAGEPYDLAFTLDAEPSAQPGALTVGVRADAAVASTQAALDWSPRIDIRLRTIAQPDAAVDVGTHATVSVELCNAGDSDANVALAPTGAASRILVDDVETLQTSVRLGAGDRMQLRVAVFVSPRCSDGALLASGLRARIDGSDVAFADFPIRVRARALDDSRSLSELAHRADEVATSGAGTHSAFDEVFCFDASPEVDSDTFQGDSTPVDRDVFCVDAALPIDGAGDRLRVEARLGRDDSQHGRDCKPLATLKAASICVAPPGVKNNDVHGGSSAGMQRLPGPSEPNTAGSVRLVVPLDRKRIDTCLDLLRTAPNSAPFVALALLRVLFPVQAQSGDVMLTARLTTLREALEQLVDRFSMKRRLPRFSASLRDCEDERTRRALSDVLATILSAPDPAPIVASPAPLLHVRFERDWAQRQLAALTDARIGEGDVLTCLTAFLPVNAQRFPALTTALTEYLAALRNAAGDLESGGGKSAEVVRAQLVEAFVQLPDAAEMPAM